MVKLFRSRVEWIFLNSPFPPRSALAHHYNLPRLAHHYNLNPSGLGSGGGESTFRTKLSMNSAPVSRTLSFQPRFGPDGRRKPFTKQLSQFTSRRRVKALSMASNQGGATAAADNGGRRDAGGLDLKEILDDIHVDYTCKDPQSLRSGCIKNLIGNSNSFLALFFLGSYSLLHLGPLSISGSSGSLEGARFRVAYQVGIVIYLILICNWLLWLLWSLAIRFVETAFIFLRAFRGRIAKLRQQRHILTAKRFRASCLRLLLMWALPYFIFPRNSMVFFQNRK